MTRLRVNSLLTVECVGEDGGGFGEFDELICEPDDEDEVGSVERFVGAVIGAAFDCVEEIEQGGDESGLDPELNVVFEVPRRCNALCMS